MRKFMLLAAAATLIMPLCSRGASCVSGTLSSYLALGSAGCTLGSNTLFDFQILNGTAGAMELSGANVSLMPLGGSFDPGLTASVIASARPGIVVETFFTFKISGNSYTSSSITLAGSSETGDGAVSGIENYCAGGVFGSSGVTGCTGVPATLLTVDGVQNSDSRSFAPVSLVSVTNELTVDGGIAGTASGGTLTDRFTATSAVPEPASLILTALGVGLSVAARKKWFC